MVGLKWILNCFEKYFISGMLNKGLIIYCIVGVFLCILFICKRVNMYMLIDIFEFYIIYVGIMYISICR